MGSDDGAVHVTRDDGATWDDVTPGDLRGAMVNAIEVSPHDPGTVYVAVAGYKMNGFSPYIYKLTDYGQGSTRIDGDLPDDNFIRVVREDPVRPGLLYAGGEAGMYVSFDGGENWQSLDLNLPPVPVTDLTIRQGDLVAATQGRGFWVLDDLSALRSVQNEMAEKPLHVFTPAPVEMVRGGGRRSQFEGANPPRGVVLNYHIRDEHKGLLSIEIRDSDDNLVRRFSSEEGEFERCITGNMDQRLPYEIEYPRKERGANKWVWNMRRDGLRCIDEIRVFEGFAGAYVIPGNYQARISVGEVEDTVSLELIADRRVEASANEFAEVEQRIAESTTLMNDLLENIVTIRKSRSQTEALLGDFPDTDALQQPGKAAVERLTEWEKKVLQVDYETYEDEDNLPGRLVKQVRHLLQVIDDAGPPVAAGALERLEDLKTAWTALSMELADIIASDIASVNAWAQSAAVPHVSSRDEN